MIDPSPSLLIIVLATFMVAGLVKGVIGMGLPTVAMALLGSVIAPVSAAALLVVPSIVTNVWQLLTGPALGRLLRRLWPLLLGIFIGTVPGSALLVHIDPLWSGLGLGVVLVIYALYALLTPQMSVPRRHEPWLSPLVGVLTGILTGATGVLVIPAVPYLQALNLDRDELVQALGLSFTTATFSLATGLLSHSAFDGGQLGLSALAVLPALAGMWLGQRIRMRISPQTFRYCFLIALLLLGLQLCLRPFF